MKYDKNLLEKYIFEDKLSYEQIGKLYNVTGAAIKKTALRLGIELPRKRKINKCETFNKGTLRCDTGVCIVCGKTYVKYSNKKSECCSLECYQLHAHNVLYQQLINGDEKVMRANYVPRRFKKDILQEQNGVCAICGCKPEHNNKELVFILDHIDGNAANNKRDNLRLVCPNCDSQLDTYKSKNKNGARSYYRYKKSNLYT